VELLVKLITLAKEKYYRLPLKKKTNFTLFTTIIFLFLIQNVEANFQQKFIEKYKNIETLSFDFKQKIGDEVEFGSCLIKYPMLMRCEYPKKNKSIISNGIKFAVVKTKRKKVHNYSLKKTPLFYLLKKENILSLVKNYEPIKIESNVVEYEIIDNNSVQINIFFDNNSLELLGWKTTDVYSNAVNFIIRNLKENILIDDKNFEIPKEEDL